mmetsp:Transcript_10693/g.16226  ORF Transcript_10693/g.16226 Transcript_10693/m.16226 type:complete len:386 (-) Transcript_10693:87-1244(-)
MARVPSSHGLERKYKPWRKGKSYKAKKGGSLKSQLRSKNRLLSKVTDEEQKLKIQDDINILRGAMVVKEKEELEKKNADKYRQAKFFERQKLTRMESKMKKKISEAKAAADFEDVQKCTIMLEQICMDQLYVAYFPNDIKYYPLFSNGNRIVDDEKSAKKREDIRNGIIERIQSGKIIHKKNWVNLSVLKAKGFDVDMKQPIRDKDEEKVDTRFAADNDFDTKLASNETKATSNISNKKADAKIESSSDSSSSDSDSDSKSKTAGEKTTSAPAAPLKTDADNIPTVGNSSSSSDSDSSSDSESDSSDSDNDAETRNQVKTLAQKEEEGMDEESDDDFLVDDSGDADAFAKAKKEKNYLEERNDKSQGWKTQKQRPGEWKKKRERY